MPRRTRSLLGVGLAVLGLIQLSASAIAQARPTRLVLLVTGAVSLVGVEYWTISRTIGYLFGASTWMVEDRSFGSTYVARALTRLVAAVLLLWLAGGRGPDPYVGPDDPPFLIVHGTNDFVVPPTQAEE